MAYSVANKCCGYREKYMKVSQGYKELKNRVTELENELSAHKNLLSALKEVHQLQEQAKSILMHSSKSPVSNDSSSSAISSCTNSLTSDTLKIEHCDMKLVATDLCEIVEDSGIYINRKVLTHALIDSEGDGRKLARALLMQMYDPQLELVNHSLSGRKSNAFKDRVCKPQIDQRRLKAILNYVRLHTATDISKVKASLSNKLKELSKFYEMSNEN